MQHVTIATPVSSPLAVLRRSPLAAGSWIVLIAWLACTAAAFWYFELSDWRPFAPVARHPFANADAALAEQWFRENVQPQTLAGTRPPVTFVHLYNAECRCNRFTEPHLQRLMQRFQPSGVRFLAALAPQATAAGLHAPFDIPLIRSHDGLLAAAGIDAAPAALMFDADGRLIYYGPYSDAAWCGSGGALVDPALERALSGIKTMTVPPASRGCFCEW